MTFAFSRPDLVKPSASAWVSQAAKEAKAREDVIDLWLGEPDFDTPTHGVEAAHQAALRGKTRYPPTNGTREMRQAVVDKLKRENDLSFAVDAMLELLKDADMVVHFGAYGAEAPFQTILGPNIVGAYNIWEAAYRNGVRRVVHAEPVLRSGQQCPRRQRLAEV
jgi:hypothetical protein